MLKLIQGSATAGQASTNGKAAEASDRLPAEGTAEQVKTADTAAEVADTAEKIDEDL